MLRFLAGFLFVLALYFHPAHVHAKAVKPLKADTILRKDSSNIAPAEFNREAIRDYQDQKEFQYDDNQAQQLSWWDKFWMLVWGLIARLFYGAASNYVLKYFFIGAGVAIIIYIVIRMVGAENIFSRRSPETILPYDVITENIHDIDYDQELNRLISEGKYRLAVRMLYLQSLKKLSDAQIIQWQPDKTNYNYLTEISEPALRNNFSRLTIKFDYIWYGDFPIDSHNFQPINQLFNEFKTQIK
ncbi:DUF4129 domain-containing protein [Pedobacter frigidisoli]|uniref:DUF4129 domain-containing protein n=1 Tax=Pedobacter frigidisoli TaxID=2530455 RepID=UPI0029315B8C|nr:DUF4129 domain-containing protein [Pedobacter frigidisoli]